MRQWRSRCAALLIVIGANPGSTQTALANAFGSNRSLVVRMIDKLEDSERANAIEAELKAFEITLSPTSSLTVDTEAASEAEKVARHVAVAGASRKRPPNPRGTVPYYGCYNLFDEWCPFHTFAIFEHTNYYNISSL